jgi:peptidoglycan L-alanyl-D-glutamate endopeptidase CwlK
MTANQSNPQNGFKLSPRSSERLASVHKDLARIVRRALQLSTIDFSVLEGRRSLERQALLYASGATRTLNSRHLSGHAVDLGAWVGGAVRWDWPLYETINQAMQWAATELGVPVEWGGNWKNFKDGPHFQLPWEAYPILRQAQDEEIQNGEAG